MATVDSYVDNYLARLRAEHRETRHEAEFRSASDGRRWSILPRCGAAFGILWSNKYDVVRLPSGAAIYAKKDLHRTPLWGCA